MSLNCSQFDQLLHRCVSVLMMTLKSRKQNKLTSHKRVRRLVMNKEYNSLEEILKDAELGKVSEYQLMQEGLRKCFSCKGVEDKLGGKLLPIGSITHVLDWMFSKEFRDWIHRHELVHLLTKRKWICATCKEDYNDSRTSKLGG